MIDHLSHDFQTSKIIPLISEAFLLSTYEFLKYKKEAKKHDFDVWILSKAISSEEGKSLIDQGVIMAEGVNLARDLVNEPANIANPVGIADRVTKIFAGMNVEVDIYDEKYLEENGFGGIIAVGKGSNIPPRLVVIKYTPKKD